MTMMYRVCGCLLLLVVFSIPTAAFSYERPQRLVVVADDNYPPYIFRDKKGDIHGILRDQWKLWEEQTGIPVDLKAMNWSSAQQFMKEGKADVIDTIFLTQERLAIYDFTRPYATIEVPVFFNKSISGITDISSLGGFTIGVKEGDACIDVFRQNGITTLREFKNYEDIIRNAGEGQLKLFCVDKPPALYYLFKLNLEKEFRYSFTLYSGEFHRAVKKGDADLLALVESGFASIPEQDYASIDKKWMGSKISRTVDYHYFLYGSIIVLILFLNLGYINFLLSRNIRKKTDQLRITIDDLRVSENQKKAFIAAIPDIIFVVSRDGRFTDFNAPSPGMLAINPEDFLGRTLYELPLKESFIREAIDLIRSALDTGKIQHYIYDMGVEDGSKTYEARVVPYDRDSVLWISRDITDSVRKDEQLLQAQKMETIGNLAGGLAHDFNNVLGGIIGTTSLLKYSLANGRCDAAALFQDVDTIEEIAKRGADIVSQLLSVSRKRELSLDLIDLNQSVEQVVTICRNTFDKSVAISVFPFEFPCYISADRAQVEQVILNLCVNGYHAMTIMRGREEKMGGDLTVRVETVEDGSGFHNVHPDAAGKKFVSVIVSDTGIGMDPYVQSRIFDPFYTTKESIRGTGLGLTMVLNIVQQHGGFIDVFSEPGQGSTFRVSLPASELPLPGIKAAEAETVVHGSGLVLIIDDEDIIRETAARILEYCGYDVITAADGEKGVELFRTEHSRISGVILDMSMPRMSGRDALVELKKIDPEVKVLLSSGFREDPRVQECFEIGIRDFVQKPFTMSELASRVHGLVIKESK